MEWRFGRVSGQTGTEPEGCWAASSRCSFACCFALGLSGPDAFVVELEEIGVWSVMPTGRKTISRFTRDSGFFRFTKLEFDNESVRATQAKSKAEMVNRLSKPGYATG